MFNVPYFYISNRILYLPGILALLCSTDVALALLFADDNSHITNYIIDSHHGAVIDEFMLKKRLLFNSINDAIYNL